MTVIDTGEMLQDFVADDCAGHVTVIGFGVKRNEAHTLGRDWFVEFAMLSSQFGNLFTAATLRAEPFAERVQTFH